MIFITHIDVNFSLQVSLLSEGPIGKACYLSSHNATDNTPRVVQLRRTTRVKRAKQNTPPKPEVHEQYGYEYLYHHAKEYI